MKGAVEGWEEGGDGQRDESPIKARHHLNSQIEGK